MKKELLAAKLSQLGFADLEALKRLKSNEIAEMVRLEADKMGFWEELANFNLVIDNVISNKIAELETNNVTV